MSVCCGNRSLKAHTIFVNVTVSLSQTGFMKGRQLSENILKIMEVMEHCDLMQENGLLISFDFYKAFDTVNWTALFNAFRAFGFGDRYIDMIKIVFNNPILYAMNNGYWGNPIKPTRGCRQGCCFSPLAFLVLIELLGIAIRQNEDIEGFSIGEEKIVSGQFADDLWSTLKPTAKNVDTLLTEIEQFGSYSGLRLIQHQHKLTF